MEILQRLPFRAIGKHRINQGDYVLTTPWNPEPCGKMLGSMTNMDLWEIVMFQFEARGKGFSRGFKVHERQKFHSFMFVKRLRKWGKCGCCAGASSE